MIGLRFLHPARMVPFYPASVTLDMSRGPSARPLAVAPGSVRAVITPFGEKPGAAGREITDANSITLSSQKECLRPHV
jgi:hypothetical protein